MSNFLKFTNKFLGKYKFIGFVLLTVALILFVILSRFYYIMSILDTMDHLFLGRQCSCLFLAISATTQEK